MFRSRNFPSEVKAMLKMAQTRLSIHKSKRQNENNALRREIGTLLSNGKDESARIKVERVIQNDYWSEAAELLDMYADLVQARAALLDQTKGDLPVDLKEAACTLMWASGRTEVEELMKFRQMMGSKFGPNLVQTADANVGQCVNPRVVFKMSIVVPEHCLCVEYLNNISAEFGIDWDASRLNPYGALPGKRPDLSDLQSSVKQPTAPSAPEAHPASPPPPPPSAHGIYAAPSGVIPSHVASPPPPVSPPADSPTPVEAEDDYDELQKRFEALKKKS
eukprot:ANDGO_04928.mRNA.1 IST1-like protein